MTPATADMQSVDRLDVVRRLVIEASTSVVGVSAPSSCGRLLQLNRGKATWLTNETCPHFNRFSCAADTFAPDYGVTISRGVFPYSSAAPVSYTHLTLPTKA